MSYDESSQSIREWLQTQTGDDGYLRILARHFHIELDASSPTPEAWLLQHGTGFLPAQAQPRMKDTVTHECTIDALRYAAANNLRYAQGLARDSASREPICHAWCVNEAGEAVDPSWGPPGGAEYFGTVFDIPEVLARLAAQIPSGAGDEDRVTFTYFMFLRADVLAGAPANVGNLNFLMSRRDSDAR